MFAPLAATFSLNLSAAAACGVALVSLWAGWHWEGAGRGSSVMCQVTTAGHFLPAMPNLTLRRFGQSVVQPGISVSPQHHPLHCESTSLDFNAKLRGRWELKAL